MSTYLVDVTAEDISTGIPLDVCLCPVAQAMGRLFSPLRVTVAAFARLWDGYEPHPIMPTIKLPAVAQEFILDFEGMG